jgi:uncharacterized membrane protein YedE/YeeE
MPATPTLAPPTDTQSRVVRARAGRPGRAWLAYLGLGFAFGIVLTKAGVISWFRMQEMFRFQSFHMYGIIGSAIAVAMGSLALLKRLGARSANGALIAVPPKELGRGIRYLAGGILFGIGWALTGACPGPLVAQIGAGASVMLVAFLSALAGTWVYGALSPRLPH